MHLRCYRYNVQLSLVDHFFESELLTMFCPHFFDESLLGEEEEVGEFVAHLFNVAIVGEMQENMGEFMASRESESFYCSLLWTHIYNNQRMAFVGKCAKLPNAIGFLQP